MDNGIHVTHTPIPTAEERAQMREAARVPLPDKRFEVQMRYEKVFGAWRVTLSDRKLTLWEGTLADNAKLEAMVSRGGGFSCLADRQAVEFAIRQGFGLTTLFLTRDQMAMLEHPK